MTTKPPLYLQTFHYVLLQFSDCNNGSPFSLTCLFVSKYTAHYWINFMEYPTQYRVIE